MQFHFLTIIEPFIDRIISSWNYPLLSIQFLIVYINLFFKA